MLKKLGFLMFALGVGGASAYAGERQMCLDYCDESFENCLQIRGNTFAICYPVALKCRASCSS